MSIPGSASPLFFQTAAGAAAGFSLQKSVRFNSDNSAYLNRTPIVGGNRKIFTYSTWVKRSSLSDAVEYALFSAGTSSYNIFGIRSDGRVRLEGNAPSMDIHTLGRLRDPSAWYHIVFAIDTTQATASNRVKIYINGVQQDLGSSTYPAQNGEFSVNDNSAVHQIGRYSTSRYFDGYMASTVFIDEAQLDCTSFGEFDDNGVWQAIDVSGLTFETNGFHLFDFANESGIGNDSSGNDNDFTVNNLTSEGGSTVRTTELSVNHASGVISLPGNAFDSTYISARINTSTFAVTNTAWLGSYANGYAEARWIPVGGYAVTSSLRVYFGVYSNAAASSTLTVTYTDSSTESSSQFTSSNNNWMTLFTASNAAGKTIQKIEISNPSATNVQFGGFVVDDQIVESANADTDVLRDVPTNGNSSDDTGAGGEVSGNYATWNPLTNRGVVTTSDGNLTANAINSGYGYTLSTIPVSSGKYYCEISFEGTMEHSTNYNYIGIVPTDSAANFTNQDIFRADGALSIDSDSSVIRGTIGTGSGDTNNTYQSSYGFDENDTIGIAIDCDTPQVTFYKNGTSIGTFPHTMQSNKSWVLFANDWANGADFTGYILNAGQRTFKNSAPSGFKALCTTNLPTPTIADGSDYFDIATYGGGANSYTISGLSFSPDLVWSKRRDSAGRPALVDTIRAATKQLSSDRTSAEITVSDGLEQFNSDGYVVGTDAGEYGWNGGASSTFVNWIWDGGTSTVSNTDGDVTSSVRANQTAGFSIVKWTAPTWNGSPQSVGHNLNAAPAFIIAKGINNAASWYCYHKDLDASNPEDKYLSLNGSDSVGTLANSWGTSAPNNTTFGDRQLGWSGGQDVIAYCMSPVTAYSAFGSYSGTGADDGPFVFTGMRPRWIMIKASDHTTDWAIIDTARDTYNPLDTVLDANNNGADSTSSNHYVDILSNGFKLRTSTHPFNAGYTYIYAAFAENPFQANGGLAR